jgi:hypothetical protein
MSGRSGGGRGEAPSISGLERLVAALAPAERRLFRRIFSVETVTGRLRVPAPMRPWVEQRFGSVAAVEEQRIVRVTDVVTLEGALFSPLRSLRTKDPAPGGGQPEARPDPLAQPEESTTEDPFGRVRGRYCTTASNVARYEGLHALVVFNEPDALRFDERRLADYVQTALEWFRRAHDYNPEARYPFLMWNCGQRAGASLQHGHAQVMLARSACYPRIERLRRAALDYRRRYRRDYFADLFHAHEAVGCGFAREGARVMAHLAPVKNHEVIVLAPSPDATFVSALYRALACLRDRFQVGAFNLAVYLPPLAPAPEDWSGFPVFARAVDRGRAGEAASDIGSMELYAAAIVDRDPFILASHLREAMAT